MAVPKEPIARGVVVTLAQRHSGPIAMLEREALSMLRAMDTEARGSTDVPPDADFVALIIESASSLDKLALPELKDRAATVVAIGEDAPECRLAITRARKQLRGHGAALGARELALAPSDFGVLGLESDGLRERLEILLRALTVDAERLRLRREGWEEPLE